MKTLLIISIIEIIVGIFILFRTRNWERSFLEGFIKGVAIGTLVGGMLGLFLIFRETII